MKLISAVLARNEAGPDRYLTRVLARCAEFSDQIVLLDDQSTDNTAEIAEQHGALVRRREPSVPTAWGNEAPARAELWRFAVEQCTDARSWVLVCDADQLLHGDPRPLMASREVNSWAWPLYDVWSEDETLYREDQFWLAHYHPRVWMVAPLRQPLGWEPQWNPRGVHCGHLPLNWHGLTGLAPKDLFWIHLGYSKPHHRDEKFHSYLANAHHLSPDEVRHAESILAPNP